MDRREFPKPTRETLRTMKWLDCTRNQELTVDSAVALGVSFTCSPETLEGSR